MKDTKGKLELESERLEEYIMELRDIITPVQSAKLVSFIERNKYKQEMELWVKRNLRKFSEETSPASDPGITKTPKLGF